MENAPEVPSDILVALDEWFKAYSEEREMFAFLFSGAVERFEERMWAEYTRLDSHRDGLSLPRRDWQWRAEGNREWYCRFMRAWYSPWTEEQMKFSPLWVCLSWDNTSVPEHQRVQYPWRVALSNWSLFKNRFENSPDFRQKLSSSQLSSYELLKDWWKARYCDKGLVEKAKAYMDQQSRHRWPQIWYRESEHLHEALGDLNSETPMSRYEYRCFRLFVSEFHPDYWQPLAAKAFLDPLISFRRDSAQCAIAQRLAYPMLSRAQEVGPREDVHAGYPMLSLTPITASPGRPHYLWDTVECRTIEAD